MKIGKTILSIILLGFLIVVMFVSIPKKYNVESIKKRKSTQYWQLETGSKIGYTKIETDKSQKKNPIIYLHGGPGGKVNDQVIELLKPLSKLGHDLYFYDQVGSGHSIRLDKISDYTVKRHQEDLNEIIAKTKSNQVILIGKSWGACLAINYLQDHNEKIEKIILVGPGPILPINRKEVNVIAPDSLSLIEPEFSNTEGNKEAYNWRSRLILKWAYLFNSKLATDQEVDDFFTYLNQHLNKSTDCKIDNHKKIEGGGGYYSHIMTFKSIDNVENKRNKLKGLRTPILILRGQCDNQKWGYVNEYLDLFLNSRLEIINGAGHHIINKEKEKYYKLTEQFLHEK